MKLSIVTLFFLSTATAFTAGPNRAGFSVSRTKSLAPASTMKMVPDEFAQSEIDSNDVRLLESHAAYQVAVTVLLL